MQGCHVIPVLRRLRQEDHPQFEDSLDYVVSLSQDELHSNIYIYIQDCCLTGHPHQHTPSKFSCFCHPPLHDPVSKVFLPGTPEASLQLPDYLTGIMNSHIPSCPPPSCPVFQGFSICYGSGLGIPSKRHAVRGGAFHRWLD